MVSSFTLRFPVRMISAILVAIAAVGCGGKISESPGTTTTPTPTPAVPSEWVGKWIFSVNDAIGHCETVYNLADNTTALTGRFTYDIASDGSFTFTETVWPKSSCDRLTNPSDTITSISQLEGEILGTITFRGRFSNFKRDGTIQVKDSQTGALTSANLRGTGYVQSVHDTTSAGITISDGLKAKLANPNAIQRLNQKHTGVVLNLDAPAGGKKDALCIVDRPLSQNHATIIGDKDSASGGDWHCHFSQA